MDHFCCLLLFLTLTSTFGFSGAGVLNISCFEGEDCVLLCTISERGELSLLIWISENKHVLIYRDGNLMDGYEHSDYTNRVQLLDPQLQRGDLSLVLKNVTLKDSGTYQCKAINEDNLVISKFIHLRITERKSHTTTLTEGTEPTEGLGTGSVITTVIGVMIGVCLLIGFILYFKQSKCSQFRSGSGSSPYSGETLYPLGDQPALSHPLNPP